MAAVKWPWVSRRAYDLAVERYERAEAQAKDLMDHLTRVSRREMGMPEQPRALPPREVEIPTAIEMLIRDYDSENVRVDLRRQVIAAHRAGTPWDQIKGGLEAEAVGA